MIDLQVYIKISHLVQKSTVWYIVMLCFDWCLLQSQIHVDSNLSDLCSLAAKFAGSINTRHHIKTKPKTIPTSPILWCKPMCVRVSCKWISSSINRVVLCNEEVTLAAFVHPSLYHSYESIQTLFILVTNLKSFPFLFSCSLYFNKAIELSSLCFNKTQLYLVLKCSHKVHDS